MIDFMPENERDYSLLDHTADLGIRVTGASAADLFKKCALAVMNLLFDTTIRASDKNVKETVPFFITGQDWEDLMVNFMREILFLWNGQARVLVDLVIKSIQAHEIDFSAIVTKNEFLEREPKREIKAVTYHQIEVRQTDALWVSRIIFDI
jgi:SHS2 domain-containing protein